MSDDRRIYVRSALKGCAKLERESLARLLGYLGEFDAQQWYTFEACSSSFGYLTERLGFRPGSAWKRLVVARAARRFPVILTLIREGKVHMTGVSMIARRLDESNVDFFLGAIMGKTKGQIQEFLADLNPQPVGDSDSTSPGGSKGDLVPLGGGNWRIEIIGNAELKALVDEALELSPFGADLASVVRTALEEFVRRKRTRKYGAGRPNGASSAAKGQTRYIPVATRKAVYERDGGQCAFVDDRGRRCSERRQLQFDHVKPVCRGGGHAVENVRLLCSAHNRHEAREVLGWQFMQRWYSAGGS